MCHQFCNEIGQFFGIRVAYFLVLSNHDLFEQFVRSVSSERWSQHCHLIEDTSQRPNIAFVVVRFLIPHLRRGVVRRSSLGDSERIDQMFGDIQITNFGNFAVEEDVGRFDISVDDVSFMKFSQSLENVVCNFPDLLLGNSVFGGEGFFDFMLNR